MKTDEGAREEVEALLEVKTEDVGGGNDVFMFHRAGFSITFGWANGPLGFDLLTDDGRAVEHGELFSTASAYHQAWFIRATCERLAFPLVTDAQDAANIAAMAGPVAPPTPYTVGPMAGASVVYDANMGAITGPINGKAALLFAAAPEMLAALEAVALSAYDADGDCSHCGQAYIGEKPSEQHAEGCAIAGVRAAIARAEGR